jgi:hypothetical protein
MKFLSTAFNKLVDWMEQYNRYKTAALLSQHVRDKKELDEILKELYK